MNKFTPDLTCIACQWFFFDSGHLGYSEYTPGSGASIKCSLNHWEVNMNNDTDDSYRLKLLTAKSCKDFELYEPSEK